MPSISRILALFFLLAALPLAADPSQFPRPTELEPDINFWISVFTEYTSDQGVLHDNRNLAVTYEEFDIPASVSRRERNRRTGARRKHYQSVLRTLASGKRDKLTAEEKRVLELWPAAVTNEVLRDAINRIRYQQGLADRFHAGLERAGQYRSHVNNTFTRLKVPVELAALPHVESSYNPDARSHVGASGIWQFTTSTGRRFLQVDHVLDERNDPYAATEAAGKLLAYNYSIAGNWPMAITAYNHGLSGVRRAMRKFGDTAYVRILREYHSRTFGFASRNFYVAFLAAMQVDQNAEQYFPGIVPDRPIDYATVNLPAYVSADSVAKSLGVSRADLARHNPALQPTIWQGSKHLPKGYGVRMPRSVLTGPISQLIAALPADEQFERQLPDLFHTVARGDTLSEIAEAYRTRISTLVALNNLGSRHRIRAGQRLRLPAAGPVSSVAAAAAPAVVEPQLVAVLADAPATVVPAGSPEAEKISPGALADQLVTTLRGAMRSTLLSDPSDYSVAADNTIEVQPLETLGHYGDWLSIKTQRLRDINGLAFRAPVVVGQRIRLDMSQVAAESFENLRTAYHRQQQDAFFRNHTITGVKEHTIKRNESVWILSLRQYDVPIWLFRQYNPALDLHKVRPGTRIRFPVLASDDG
ncbi:MAG: transglycosylase SLT domain-containing protein [Proteobacteria bacterium]|nr:transglycosylase SLT domain-containing protein [Pseudomonadota bacterium]